MKRRRFAAVGVVVAMGMAVAACSGSSSSSPSSSLAACARGTDRVSMVLSDRLPVPVVRIPVGGCVEITVPSSPFRSAHSEPPVLRPVRRLALVGDRLGASGTRTIFYRALLAGTTAISSTVKVTDGSAVPIWSGIVLAVGE